MGNSSCLSLYALIKYMVMLNGNTCWLIYITWTLNMFFILVILVYVLQVDHMHIFFGSNFNQT